MTKKRCLYNPLKAPVGGCVEPLVQSAAGAEAVALVGRSERTIVVGCREKLRHPQPVTGLMYRWHCAENLGGRFAQSVGTD